MSCDSYRWLGLPVGLLEKGPSTNFTGMLQTLEFSPIKFTHFLLFQDKTILFLLGDSRSLL